MRSEIRKRYAYNNICSLNNRLYTQVLSGLRSVHTYYIFFKPQVINTSDNNYVTNKQIK